jgi:hypothetical protein
LVLDALFYPTLSLPRSAWTYPNLLYFDKIGVIAPHGDERELFDGPTRVLMSYGLVDRVNPEQYAVDEENDAIVVAHLHGIAQTRRPSGPRARIHIGKIGYTSFPTELRDLGFLSEPDPKGWLEGPAWVCDYVMSVLATRIMNHPGLNLSLLTNQPFANRVVAGVPPSRRSAVARRVEALARLLPIGPDAEIDEILRFRRRHEQELKQFRRFVEQLVLRSGEGPDSQMDFERRLRDAERLRADLVDALRDLPSRPSPVDIGLAIAPVAASITEDAYYSAGAAVCGLAVLLYRQSEAYRRRRAISSDKLVYAALAERKIAARRADDLLR